MSSLCFTICLSTDWPRGQVGTVVDALDRVPVLVEFSDDNGVAYAITSVPISMLLVLHCEPAEA